MIKGRIIIRKRRERVEGLVHLFGVDGGINGIVVLVRESGREGGI